MMERPNGAVDKLARLAWFYLVAVAVGMGLKDGGRL